MARLLLASLIAASLAACGGGGGGSKPRPVPPPPTSLDPLNPVNVQIGPVISGRNYSIGTPLRPVDTPDGWAVPIGPDAEPHYVTWPTGSLIGKTFIVVSGRIEMDEATVIYPKCCISSPASLSLYFQVKDDDWRSDGKRWWATFARITPLRPGPFTLIAPFDGDWTSVLELHAVTSPTIFRSSLANAGRIGFTFGGGDGEGHGVRATAPARLVVTDIRFE